MVTNAMDVEVSHVTNAMDVEEGGGRSGSADRLEAAFEENKVEQSHAHLEREAAVETKRHEPLGGEQ